MAVKYLKKEDIPAAEAGDFVEFKEGDEIEVKVLDFDKEREK